MVGGASSTHESEREGNCIITKFKPGTLEGRDHLKDTGVTGEIILKLI
jgi:hypothetical protein